MGRGDYGEQGAEHPLVVASAPVAALLHRGAHLRVPLLHALEWGARLDAPVLRSIFFCGKKREKRKKGGGGEFFQSLSSLFRKRSFNSLRTPDRENGKRTWTRPATS